MDAVSPPRARDAARCFHPFVLAGLLLPIFGCTHMGMVNGAIPLPNGEHEFTGEVSYARAPDVFGTSTGVALPALGFHYRRGITENADIGLNAYTLGIGADLRYRFAEVGGFHFAVQPSIAGLFFPLGTVNYGALDIGFPLRIERPIGKLFSVTLAPGVVARQTFLSATTDDITTASGTFELYAGGGTRGQVAFRRVHFGLSGNLYVDTQRGTGLYGGIAIDFGIKGRPRASNPARSPEPSPPTPDVPTAIRPDSL